MSEAPKYAAVFLDRDGTIIEDQHYPKDADKVRLLPGAAEGLHEFLNKGYLLFVISNQSGVGRGIISPSEFEAVHKKTDEVLKEAGITVAGFYYCKHTPDDHCECRKPGIGLIPKEFNGAPLDWKKSIVIGDRESDLLLGNNLEAASFLVETGKGKKTLEELNSASRKPEFHPAKNLLEVAKTIPNSPTPKM